MDEKENLIPADEAGSTGSETLKVLTLRETSEVRLANDEFINRMMSFSPFGALVQPFILEAVRNYSKAVSEHGATPPAEYRSFIAWEDWHGVACDVYRQISERLGTTDLTDVDKVQEHAIPSAHGWVAHNGGPDAWFWSEDRASLEHELSEDIRPATSLEKAMLIANGRHWPTEEQQAAIQKSHVDS